MSTPKIKKYDIKCKKIPRPEIDGAKWAGQNGLAKMDGPKWTDKQAERMRGISLKEGEKKEDR